MSTVLSLLNVSFQAAEKVLIDNVSFDIEEGACLCIIGPSGCGKSTLIRMFNRLNVKTAGEILYRNMPIESYTVSELRHQIAMVFQRTSVFPGTVADNLKLAFQFNTKALVEQEEDLFISALHQAGLNSSYLSKNAQLLSGGEQQRLGIARALVTDAQVICLDEPTSALDVEAANLVVDSIKALRGQKTVVMVNHRLEEVEEVATHVAMIDSGKIVEMGTVEEIFKNPKSNRLKAFLVAYRKSGVAS